MFYHDPNLGPCAGLCHNRRALSATCRSNFCPAVNRTGIRTADAIYPSQHRAQGGAARLSSDWLILKAPPPPRNTYMPKSRQTCSEAAKRRDRIATL